MISTFDDVADSLAEQFLGVLPVRPSADVTPDYAAAFRAWENLLGAEHVRCDASTRDDYARTTLPVGTRPAGVVRPHTTNEVCEVVKIARQFSVPLHAISRGKNWGYGDACAPADGYVIVELTRMNRIREVNVELGYAVIEPGVSQGQMYEYLRDNNLPLLLDVTGAGPDASIVGNILQRGFGHTPYGDRFRHTSGFEVVLPDGRLINTGFGQFENAKAAHVFPWGVGPWIDGLFTQSDYGIVTSACIWLMPKPEVIEGFACKIDDESKLGPLLDAIRKLRMGGTIRSTVHIANDLRVLSSRMRYPWDRAQGVTPLPERLRQQLRRENGLGVWNVLGATYGTQAAARAARADIRRAFREICRVHFFRRSTLNKAQILLNRFGWTKSGRRLRHTVAAAGSAFDLLEGIPTCEHLAGAQWRCRTESAELRDSGLIWVSPVVPMDCDNAQELLAIVEPCLARSRIDALITMTALTERALCCVISINYSKTKREDIEQAYAAYESIKIELTRRGNFPYRASGPMTSAAKKSCCQRIGSSLHDWSNTLIGRQDN